MGMNRIISRKAAQQPFRFCMLIALPFLFAASLLALGSAACCVARDDVAGENVESIEDPDQLAAAIQKHIKNLGHPSYAVRSRAKLELERMGLIALDAIREAEDSSDTEIASSARYLMSNLEVQWSKESDPIQVQQILSEYGAQRDSERKSRMDQLAGLPDQLGLVPLARLARFEQSLRLSRLAALLAMRPVKSEAEPDDEIIRRMVQTIGDSRRTSADWLRQYLNDLRNHDYDQAAWRKMIDAERELVDNGSSPSHTDAVVLLEFYRVSAVRAQANGNRSEAVRLAMASLDKVMSRRQDLMDAVSWALDSEMVDVVLELEKRDPQRFAAEAELLYAVAEAQLILGNNDKAESLRLSALQIDQLPAMSTEETEGQNAKGMAADVIEQRAMRHCEIGRVLETRGRFAWAEGEYRHVIENLPPDSISAASNRVKLADLLGSLEEHQAVVDVLFPFVDRTSKDSIFRARCQQLLIDTQYYHGKYFYHMALASEGAEARDALRKAIRQCPTNPDILIAMYRQTGDAEWKRETDNSIDQYLDRSEILINRLEQMLKERGAPDVGASVAQECNEYAWLASNTDRQLSKAVKFSQRSLELAPGLAGYRDTLGRCYFAMGDLDEAIYHQRLALRIDPHDASMLRQLDLFVSRKQQLQDTPETENTPNPKP